VTAGWMGPEWRGEDWAWEDSDGAGGGGATWLLVRVRGRREEAGTHGLNPLIFSGQGTAAENKELFSVAVLGAVENKLIFGGQIQPLKVSGYFRRLRPDRRK
jgi:hypothetical protein